MNAHGVTAYRLEMRLWTVGRALAEKASPHPPVSEQGTPVNALPAKSRDIYWSDCDATVS